LSKADPTVLEDLRRLVEPATMGDPMRPLLWVSKSREKLAVALRAMDHPISANTGNRGKTPGGGVSGWRRTTADEVRQVRDDGAA